jgi:hypothetical protein
MRFCMYFTVLAALVAYNVSPTLTAPTHYYGYANLLSLKGGPFLISEFPLALPQIADQIPQPWDTDQHPQHPRLVDRRDITRRNPKDPGRGPQNSKDPMNPKYPKRPLCQPGWMDMCLLPQKTLPRILLNTLPNPITFLHPVPLPVPTMLDPVHPLTRTHPNSAVAYVRSFRGTGNVRRGHIAMERCLESRSHLRS